LSGVRCSGENKNKEIGGKEREDSQIQVSIQMEMRRVEHTGGTVGREGGEEKRKGERKRRGRENEGKGGVVGWRR
jgi:hypothetical protein